MSNIFEQNLQNMGISLPAVANPVANYVPFVKIGERVIISGQISRDEDSNLMIGTLGQNYTIGQGVIAAGRCALYILAVLKQACDGDLMRVKKCVKLGGFVNSTPDFKDHPQVINGASDIMVSVFGQDIGKHARAAVGVSSLPLGVAVEVEAEFLISEK